jgi:hypothetical protein
MSAEARLARLDALNEELTVDAYDEDEQLTGLLSGVEEALRPPEAATIVGVPVQVVAVIEGPDVRRGLIAVCERDGARHEVSLADLRFKPDSQLGVMAAAYRRWLGCSP